MQAPIKIDLKVSIYYPQYLGVRVGLGKVGMNASSCSKNVASVPSGCQLVQISEAMQPECPLMFPDSGNTVGMRTLEDAFGEQSMWKCEYLEKYTPTCPAKHHNY